MDNLTRSQRRKCMQRNKRRDTKPEIVLKDILIGFEFQPDLPGHPDFADRSQRIAIFVDGCFWHKCPEHFKMPKSNTDYWMEKIERNTKRDQVINSLYSSMGWNTARIYEHDLKGKAGLEIKEMLDHILRQYE